MKLYRFKPFEWFLDFNSIHKCETAFWTLSVVVKGGDKFGWYADDAGQGYDSDESYSSVEEAKAAAEEWYKGQIMKVMEEVEVDA